MSKEDDQHNELRDRIERPDAYDGFKSYGFEAGEPVLYFIPKFTLTDLQEAHYGSTYHEPMPLTIEFADDFVLRVVVQMTRAVYRPIDDEIESLNPHGCYKHPEWYGEGWLLKSGFDPYAEVVRVRFRLSTTLDGKFEEGFIQRIPKDPDPDGHIDYRESL